MGTLVSPHTGKEKLAVPAAIAITPKPLCPIRHDGRPMKVSVEYSGVLPDAALEDDTFPKDSTGQVRWDKVTTSEIRKASVSLLEGVQAPFQIVSDDIDALAKCLVVLGVSDEIRADITACMLRDDYAPKYDRIFLNQGGRGQIHVVISYDDAGDRDHLAEIVSGLNAEAEARDGCARSGW